MDNKKLPIANGYDYSNSKIPLLFVENSFMAPPILALWVIHIV